MFLDIDKLFDSNNNFIEPMQEYRQELQALGTRVLALLEAKFKQGQFNLAQLIGQFQVMPLAQIIPQGQFGRKPTDLNSLLADCIDQHSVMQLMFRLAKVCDMSCDAQEFAFACAMAYSTPIESPIEQGSGVIRAKNPDAPQDYIQKRIIPNLDPIKGVEGKYILKRCNTTSPDSVFCGMQEGMRLSAKEIGVLLNKHIVRLRKQYAYDILMKDGSSQERLETDISKESLSAAFDAAVLIINKNKENALRVELEPTSAVELLPSGQPKVLWEMFQKVFLEHFKLKAGGKAERKLHFYALWHSLWCIKKTLCSPRGLTESQANSRLVLAIVSAKGNIGKSLFCKELYSPFIQAGFGTTANIEALIRDRFSMRRIEENYVIVADELDFTKNGDTTGINRFKDLITGTVAGGGRAMYSDSNEQLMKNASYVITSNYPLNVIFDSTADHGMSRRFWQFELGASADDMKKVKGVPVDVDFTKFNWVEIWRSIDVSVEAGPYWDLSEEEQRLFSKMQADALSTHWFDEAVHSIGLKVPDTLEQGVMVPLSDITEVLHKNLVKDHLITEGTSKRFIRQKLLEFCVAHDIEVGKNCRRQQVAITDSEIQGVKVTAKTCGIFQYDDGAKVQVGKVQPAFEGRLGV